MKKVKKKLHKLILSENREKAKEQGFFDGRFCEKQIPDKKKKAKAKACRKNKGKKPEGEKLTD
ncbi:MAG: hypothetical protein PHT69_07725 [Bacteroidales bacterium]|nr:hypothetical protein [Bacteroidales bacterium]